MKRGRKPNAIPRVQCKFEIRVDLLAEMQLMLADPLRNRIKYGAKTEYLESLIERDLAERRKAAEADIDHLTTEPDARTLPGLHESGTKSD